MASSMTSPWLVGVLHIEHEDFDNCNSYYDLTKIQFNGSPFTWWNGRARHDFSFEILYRILFNKEIQKRFTDMEVENLARKRSYHALIFLSFKTGESNHRKSFRFLKFWVDNPNFLEVVRHTLFVNDSQNCYFDFKANIKRRYFGNKGLGMIGLIVETKILNSFIVKGRRRKLQLQRIQDARGTWLEEAGEIGGKVVKFFLCEFLQKRDAIEFSLLRHIPSLINEVENEALCKQPSLEEVRRVVFNVNGDSASGPDVKLEDFTSYVGRF
ncbi:hypothetical protein H5410_036304 [Solanum commersonii]|uniref:Uncharacterized protein n=1 Tax=Solanum commersonii TaxID=4109 RepID=A0A9J5Y637_SOLCO|nr:hypothetical protein H5410_036304 [Solanum commersonii]